jgi:mannose-6-phosphate isomerase-like protein (cupin superfamily)
MTDEIRLNASQVIRVVSSSPDALELESRWDSGGKPPPTHWHPNQAEHFEVLEGCLTVRVGEDAPRTLDPGDVLDVPRRTPHSMWNAGDVPARAAWRVSPSLRTEEMFRYIERGMSPLRSLGMLFRFRHEFRLGRRGGSG